MFIRLEIILKLSLNHLLFLLELKQFFKTTGMKALPKYYITIGFTCLFILNSCKKQDNFLSAKPDQSLLIATTLADYQLLLNNESVLNSGDPGLGTICADDDFYVMNSDWASALAPERNGYIWSQNFYENDAFLPGLDQSL
jgi:hypothetical protein